MIVAVLIIIRHDSLDLHQLCSGTLKLLVAFNSIMSFIVLTSVYIHIQMKVSQVYLNTYNNIYEVKIVMNCLRAHLNINNESSQQSVCVDFFHLYEYHILAVHSV